MYAYIHDQTLRLLNKGFVASEIAEQLELPASLEQEWHCRGYYGSVNHNVKAVYQRYLGWFDGNPAHLWPHPPGAAATRYVELAGGPDAILDHARRAFDNGDFRWVAEVVNHLVFADPENRDARELQARALEQLAYGAENGTWRNFFLMGARELRLGPAGTAASLAPDFVANLEDGQLFDAIAIQIDGPRAAEKSMTIGWHFTDTGRDYTLFLTNGVLRHRSGAPKDPTSATVQISRTAFNQLVAGAVQPQDLLQSGDLVVQGEAASFKELLGLLDPPDRNFAIVTP